MRQRGDVVGGGADQRVLEIDDAEPVVALTRSGAPDDVGRMEVAQHDALLGAASSRSNSGRSRPAKSSARAALGRRRAGGIGHVPVEQQVDLDQHASRSKGGIVVDRTAGRGFQRPRPAVHDGEQFAPRPRSARRPGRRRSRNALAEMARSAGSRGPGRLPRMSGTVRPLPASAGRWRRRRATVRGGVRDLGIGLAVFDDRPKHQRRRIHQQALRLAGQRRRSRSRARRGIAGQAARGGRAPAGGVEEVADGERAGDARERRRRPGR